jgi:glycosyltransferase involved in cell wall biosynthesis
VNLYVISCVVPFQNHDKPGVTASHIVASELVREIAAMEHSVTLQVLFSPHRKTNELNNDETESLRELEQIGVKARPTIFPQSYRRQRAAGLGLLKAAVDHGMKAPKLEHFYPSARIQASLAQSIRQAKADAVLTVWSPEGFAATHGLTEVPTIAYHGDIDYEPSECRVIDEDLFGKSTFLQKRDVARFRSVHMELMKGVDSIANVTASNADFYRAHGHPRSTYVRNTWHNRASVVEWPGKRPDRPVRIIGHVGYLDRTGSTYGLRFLLREVVPELARTMQDIDYEIDIIGGGELVSSLRSLTQQPRIRMRGFVQDLDAEMAGCDVMLLLNNAGRYQAAYTRHLVAWSRGLCLIAHENSRKAIPEITHGENAFLGKDAAEIARFIRLAVTNNNANARVRAGGRRTFETYFTSKTVAAGLVNVVRETVEQRAAIR